MNRAYTLQPASRQIRNRCRAVFTALVATLVSLSTPPTMAQDSSSPRSDAIAVEGAIRNSAGEPVVGASVFLEEKGKATSVETKTSADGTFVLSASHAGTYFVRATKSGLRTAVADPLVLSLGDKRHLDLVLSNLESSASSPSANSTPNAMEFKDEPNFTVAGVTDWSNLGLHGSDATSRTSEALAKETRTLKSSETEKAAGSTPGKRYDLALAYEAKGDLAQAREEVRKLLAVVDDAEGHRLLADLGERLGDPLEAVREYERAARMDPSERNYFEWGSELLLHRAGKPAAEVFTQGSRAHPKSARMLAGLGAALYSVGSYEEAARRLCEASDLQPADPAAYLLLGKIEKATSALLPCSEEKLERFAREQPGSALANYYYAISLWKRNKGSENSAEVQQTRALLEKAVSIDPQLDEAYLQLGVLHFTRGDFEPAIRAYRKAIEVNPHAAEAHYRLGLAYQQTGEKAKAQEEFQTYEQIQKTDAAEVERQRRELRQFLIILKDQPAASPRH